MLYENSNCFARLSENLLKSIDQETYYSWFNKLNDLYYKFYPKLLLKNINNSHSWISNEYEYLSMASLDTNIKLAKVYPVEETFDQFIQLN